MGQTLKVIQVGAGSFGRSWAGIVAAAPGIALVAIVEPFAPARDQVRAALNGWSGPLVASLDEALGQVDADAVLVITPPDSHHAVVTNALRAGKHVLVEKPLATTIADAADLIATADATRRTLMVSQNYRFRRYARTIQQLIAEGRLGDLISVRIAFQRDTRMLFGDGNFRYTMRHPLVLDMSIHHMDLLRAFTGQDVAHIDARSWRIPASNYLHDPAAVALIELESSISVVYEGTWASFGPETSWNGDWEFIGEDGRLTWTGGASEGAVVDLVLTRWGEEPVRLEPIELDLVDRAGSLDHFRQSIASGTEPETTARDNIRSLAAVLGIVESIDSRQAVNVGTEFEPAPVSTQP
ncbi:MAG: Gfo/Idh/MocA family protein [Thermomicrobiales bacterium]